MTKAELLKLLEPFTDDIQIVTTYRRYDGDEPIFMPAEGKYQVAKDDTKSTNNFLTKGDGYIEIA